MTDRWQGDAERDHRELGSIEAAGPAHRSAELARIHAFTRYLAAARGELPFEDYRNQMRRDVKQELGERLWARRCRDPYRVSDRRGR